MKILLFGLITTLLLIPILSIAGFGGGRGYEDGLFWSADLDRNEYLDINEAKDVYNLADKEIFMRFDENNNGYISRAEFTEFMQHSPWTKKFVHPKDREQKTESY